MVVMNWHYHLPHLQGKGSVAKKNSLWERLVGVIVLNVKAARNREVAVQLMWWRRKNPLGKTEARMVKRNWYWRRIQPFDVGSYYL